MTGAVNYCIRNSRLEVIKIYVRTTVAQDFGPSLERELRALRVAEHYIHTHI
jgi:hypothetical protein